MSAGGQTVVRHLYSSASRGRKNRQLSFFGSSTWERGMSLNHDFSPVVENVQLLIAERDQLRSSLLPFRVTHRFRMPGTDCWDGEEVLAISCTPRGREYQLRLSPALLILGDYLLRDSRFAQTASQIADGIHANSFYSEKYAANGRGRRHRIMRIPRSAIREYIKRLHRALALVFHEANLSIDPFDVLTVEESVGNQVLYQWKASSVEVVHFDLTSANAQPLR
jgi:hypothetical protein